MPDAIEPPPTCVNPNCRVAGPHEHHWVADSDHAGNWVTGTRAVEPPSTWPTEWVACTDPTCPDPGVHQHPLFISEPHTTFSATVVCNECGWTERGWVEDIERLTRQHTKETTHA